MNNSQPTTTTQIPDDKWMSFEEYQVHKQLMNQQEAACLRSNGLGWLVDFCSTKIENNEIQS